MKRKSISETIDNINPKYIDEATEYTGAEEITHRNAWYKRVLPMAAAFACVCLVVAVSAFVLPRIQDNFIGPDVLQGDDPTGNSSDITNTPPDKTNSLFVNEVSNLSSADMDVQFTHYNALNATEKDNLLKQFEAKVGLSYTEFTGMISKTFTEKQFYSVNVPTDKSRNEYTPHDYVIEYQTANEGQITLSICPTEKPLRDCIIICDNPTPSIINDASAIIYGIQNSYMVQFSHKNMYYDIETRDVTLEELELFLNSILSR